MSFCAKCGESCGEGSAYCNQCGFACATQSVALTAKPGDKANWPEADTSWSSGITPNVAGALSYLFGVVSATVFLLLDPYKQDRSVRFHCLQSIFFCLVWLGLWIVWMTFTGIFEAITGGFLAVMIIPVDCLLTLAGIALWGFLILRAYSGQPYKVPFLGNLAEQQAKR